MSRIETLQHSTDAAHAQRIAALTQLSQQMLQLQNLQNQITQSLQQMNTMQKQLQSLPTEIAQEIVQSLQPMERMAETLDQVLNLQRESLEPFLQKRMQDMEISLKDHMQQQTQEYWKTLPQDRIKRTLLIAREKSRAYLRSQREMKKTAADLENQIQKNHALETEIDQQAEQLEVSQRRTRKWKVTTLILGTVTISLTALWIWLSPPTSPLPALSGPISSQNNVPGLQRRNDA